MIRSSASNALLQRGVKRIAISSPSFQTPIPSSSSWLSPSSMQLRSFYLGGDAHLYYASRQYVFERPPNIDAAETMTSSSFGSEATKTTAALVSLQPQSMEGAGNTFSSSGAAATTCVTGSLGGAWLAYETAEFAPWEEMLLEEDGDHERPKIRQRRRDATTGRSRQRQVAKNHPEETDNEDNRCECDQNNPNDQNSNKRN
jgi:hypothetical protein